MIQWCRPWLWVILALVAVAIPAVSFCLRATLLGGSGHSPLLTPSAPGVSSLPTPTTLSPSVVLFLPSWPDAGAVLLWASLGVTLALGVAFIFIRWYRRVVL